MLPYKKVEKGINLCCKEHIMSSCDKALGFWVVGIQYLHLVQAVSSEIHRQGNTHIIMSDETITTDEYMEKTKWSDHNLVIPLLFNFFHGLETLLKGFLCANRIQVKKSHKLSELLISFKNEFYYSSLIPYFEKYIDKDKLPNILSEFCNKSNIGIDEYYQALKYSEGISGNQYQHYPLKYQGQKGVQFFDDLRKDIEKIRQGSISLGRKICQH
jgi:hypothetical protein